MNDNGGTKMDSGALNFESLNNMFGEMFGQQAVKTENVEQKELTKEEEKQAIDNNVENISSVDIDKIVTKLNAIKNELNNEFVERQDLIEIMLLAIATGSNLLMLGDPGTAKSKISKAVCNRIENSKFFEWMLNKSSDPAEILGSFSIKGMENDEFRRNTVGKLPEANIAFIDEVYKSNSPTLNALLTIMNEHIFYNNSKPVQVPLISMFAASNEPPEDDTLLALHDRFLFRIKVDYVHNASGKKKMFNNYIYERAGINVNDNFTTVTIDEINALQNKSKSIPISKNIINEYISFLANLQKNANISVSDRRANEGLKVLQGSAVLHNRNSVQVEDFKALKYVLLSKDDDEAYIDAELNKITNPYDDDFAKYQVQFNEIKDRIEHASDDKEKNQIFLQYQNSMKNIIARLNKLINNASANGKDVKEYSDFRDNILQYHTDLTSNIINNTLGN